MRAKKLAAIAIFLAAPVYAVRPPAAVVESQAIWLRIYPQEAGAYSYLEVAKDGTAIYADARKTPVPVKSGKIDERLVKDLFQEKENLDAFDSSAEAARGKLLYTRAETVELTAVYKGELRSVKIPLSSLSTGFRFALSEALKAAYELALSSGAPRFISAFPVTEADLKNLEAAQLRTIVPAEAEAFDIEKIKPLARAILKPRRLVPIPDKETLAKLDVFLSEHKIRKEKDSFYLSTSRGYFRCDLVTPASERELSAAVKKPAPKPAAKPVKRASKPKKAKHAKTN